jgi:putative membrane protein
MKLDLALVWLHVSANLFWIGAIVAVAVVLAGGAASKERGAVAEALYRRLAAPTFVLAFLAGASRLMMDAGLYLKQPWMHAKLLVAVLVIGLHHALGAKAKRMALGEEVKAGGVRAMALALAACAVLAAFFVLFKIPGRSAP